MGIPLVGLAIILITHANGLHIPGWAWVVLFIAVLSNQRENSNKR